MKPKAAASCGPAISFYVPGTAQVIPSGTVRSWIRQNSSELSSMSIPPLLLMNSGFSYGVPQVTPFCATSMLEDGLYTSTDSDEWRQCRENEDQRHEQQRPQENDKWGQCAHDQGRQHRSSCRLFRMVTGFRDRLRLRETVELFVGRRQKADEQTAYGLYEGTSCESSHDMSPFCWLRFAGRLAPDSQPGMIFRKAEPSQACSNILKNLKLLN
jgi:hypothetical protein